MNKQQAVKQAHKLAKETDTDYMVYWWTDDPLYPGPKDYHVLSTDDYWYDPAASWIDSDLVVYNTDEGYYV